MSCQTCTHGEISDISVLDPLPGLVGFTSVVSTRVHPSPLAPQLPENSTSHIKINFLSKLGA